MDWNLLKIIDSAVNTLSDCYKQTIVFISLWSSDYDYEPLIKGISNSYPFIVKDSYLSYKLMSLSKKID